MGNTKKCLKININLIARRRHNGSRRRDCRPRNDFERRASDVHRRVAQTDVRGVICRCDDHRFTQTDVGGVVRRRLVRRDVRSRRHHHSRSGARCRRGDERGCEEPLGSVVRFGFRLLLCQSLPE